MVTGITESGKLQLSKTLGNRRNLCVCDHAAECSRRPGLVLVFQGVTSISTNSFFLLQMGSRASQYLRLIAACACVHSAFGRIRAQPANSRPVILRSILQGATFTSELLRIRLNLPESLGVFT